KNRKMLSAILGIDDEEAARRLAAIVLVTAAADRASQRIADQIVQMLNRTLNASLEAHAALKASVEIIVGAAAPRTARAMRVWVGSLADGICISKDPFDQVPPTEHAIFGLIAACYACGLALRFALGRGLPFAGS